MRTKLWQNIPMELKDNILNQEILNKFISDFYNDVVININENQYINFIFRIVLINNDIKTVTKLLKLNNKKEEKSALISYITDAINLTNNNYNNTPIKKLIISYGIRKGNVISTITNLEEVKSYHVYYNHKLPITTKIEEYGDIIGRFDETTILSLKKNIQLIIKSIENKNFVKFFKNGKLMYEWTDTIEEDNSLIREIGKTTFKWKDNEILWTKVLKTTRPITKKRVSSDLAENFITMDLETYSVSDVNTQLLTPYLLSWYDGKRNKSHSYFNPKGDIKDLIYRSMKDICIRKYKGYKIYFHNFSKFDAIFLIKYLITIGDCEPIIHKGKIISFTFSPNWKKDFGSVTFLDSFLLLSNSLSKLSDSFKVENSKGIFPILFNDINHKGEVPDIKYFNNISLKDYENYKKEFENLIWNFKDEAIKYCELDCISLYQVLKKFNKLIFDKFSLNITDYPTLSSLAFSIYRSKYLPENSIHQLSGDIDKNIRSGYTGGSTDMFIPNNPDNTLIYAYDVNSLYPFVMKDYKYPVGSPTYFEGNLLKYEAEAFGFFYCNITTPLNLKHPILQLHHKTNDGFRTLSPLGTFSGWFFSEELKNSLNFGYSFEVLRGYTFEKGDIFSGYINDLYNLRLEYPKTDPMNFTAKLLLNSLYGRFGMNDSFNSLDFIDKEELIEFEESNLDIIDIIHLPTNKGEKYLITYSNPNNILETKLDGNREVHNINIAIAAAVTAYARIHMSQFKNNKDLPNLYYTDTDSAYFDGPLPDSFISNTRLGALKLEGVYDKALFLAPKVYALENTNTGERVIKIKGLSKESIKNNKIYLDSLEILLNKDYKLIYNQRKWFRSLTEANIKILEQSYNLKVTGNKRELVYKDGKLVGTNPIKI